MPEPTLLDEVITNLREYYLEVDDPAFVALLHAQLDPSPLHSYTALRAGVERLITRARRGAPPPLRLGRSRVARDPGGPERRRHRRDH